MATLDISDTLNSGGWVWCWRVKRGSQEIWSSSSEQIEPRELRNKAVRSSSVLLSRLFPVTEWRREGIENLLILWRLLRFHPLPPLYLESRDTNVFSMDHFSCFPYIHSYHCKLTLLNYLDFSVVSRPWLICPPLHFLITICFYACLPTSLWAFKMQSVSIFHSFFFLFYWNILVIQYSVSFRDAA